MTLTATVSPIPSGGTVTFTHECGGPKPVNIVTGTATCTAAIAPDPGLPCSYSGFGVFAPSVATKGDPFNVYSPSFWLATAHGRVLGYEDANLLGDTITSAASGPVVGMASTADGKGYWVAMANAGVSAIGDAPSYGDLPALGKHVRTSSPSPPPPTSRATTGLGWTPVSSRSVMRSSTARYPALASAPSRSSAWWRHRWVPATRSGWDGGGSPSARLIFMARCPAWASM